MNDFDFTLMHVAPMKALLYVIISILIYEGMGAGLHHWLFVAVAVLDFSVSLVVGLKKALVAVEKKMRKRLHS